MSKVKVETLYVPSDNYHEAVIALKDEPVNIVPLGNKKELYPGIPVYIIGVPSDTKEESLTDKEVKQYDTYVAPTLTKRYLSDEHRKRSEEKEL